MCDTRSSILNGVLEFVWQDKYVSRSSEEASSVHHRARQFTEVAFALTALAALGFALLIHHTALGSPFTEEARGVITWSFIGLAALDVLLLSTWNALIRWIVGP